MMVSIVIESFTFKITVDQDFVKDMIVASWGWNHWVSCIVTYLDFQIYAKGKLFDSSTQPRGKVTIAQRLFFQECWQSEIGKG